MEIHIRLAGAQLGPYSEKQVRDYLAEGLLSPTDSARVEGTENWVPVSELLSAPKPATVKLPGVAPTPPLTETSRRAPSAPGTTHLPPRIQDSKKVSLPSVVNALAKKTMIIEPRAPTVPSTMGHAGSSATSTAPLPLPQQPTKKVARASLVKALAQNTTPLPTREINRSPVGPASNAPAVPAPSAAPSPALPIIPSRAPSSPPKMEPPSAPDAEKTPLPSLMRALSAKTVPMRNNPAPPSAPPSAGPQSGTAPLPSKSTFKTSSGSVPPPSVVKALTKKLGRVTMAEAETSPPTLGLTPPTGAIPALEKNEADPEPVEPSLEPADEGEVPAWRARMIPILICVCAALALLSLYYVWSPPHAASQLRAALNDGDPDKLDQTIDFPAVRTSLKDQIHAQLSDSSSPDATSPGVLAMIDDSIDRYVTPSGISDLVKKADASAQPNPTRVISPDSASKILFGFNALPVKNQGLDSFADYVLDLDAVALHLQLRGLGWKLERIDLRPDFQWASLSGAPGATASPLISPVVDTYLDSGKAKAKAGDWDGAIAEFSQLLAIDPHSAAAYNARGSARQSKGDLDGALADYAKALAIDPNMAEAYEGRGSVRSSKGDLDGAIADYTQAVRLDPKLAAAYDGRGNARTVKDDLEGAIADYTEAIAIDPTMASAFSDRGFARQANGNLDGAIADYTQALILKPKTAIAYYNRGLARQSQGNLEAAIVDYDRAIVFDPKLAGAYYNRGNAKSADHDIDGAIADYTQALALNPKIALAYCYRGLARQSKGDLDGALADYTKALAVDPKMAIAYYDRSLLREQKDDFDGAIADSTQSLDLDPKNAQAYYNRGFAKLAKGNLDGAVTDLKQFGQFAPTDRSADHARLYLWLIAKAQAKTDADQDLAEALQNNWNSTSDDFVSKIAAFLLGRLPEADFLAAAASTNPKLDQSQHCEAWYFAGMARLLAGDRTMAIAYFHKCIGTGQTDFCEYILAHAELQALEPGTTASATAPAGSVTTPAPAPVSH